jgi:glutaminase
VDHGNADDARLGSGGRVTRMGVREGDQVHAADVEMSRPSAGALRRSPIADYLERLLAGTRALNGGEVATYIPELGRADPDWFGISIVTAEGHVYSVGDADLPFSIQSISKPFVWGAALEDRGRDAVLARIGVEPSGNAFNAILVDETSNRPFNPMVNAGAIVATGQLARGEHPTLEARLLAMFESYIGAPPEVDEEVYRSELATGDRNRAIAYMMRGFGMLDDSESVLDLYFRQCAARVTCNELAVMGATLANGGVNPITGVRALDAEYVPDVLSVMSTCGMYDYSGEWVYRVGLPAKSGVSGGVLAILPGQLAVAVFSPPLDPRGNSVRGLHVCERISQDHALHLLRVHSPSRNVVRRTYRGDEFRSNRQRPEHEDLLLSERSHAIVVHELQGDLHFASTEIAFQTIVSNLDRVELVVLDLRRVGAVDSAAASLLAALDATLGDDVHLVLAHVGAGAHQLVASVATETPLLANVDAALEWCEDRLLDPADEISISHPADVDLRAALATSDLLHGLDDEQVAAVAAVAEVEQHLAGDTILREGDEADAVYLLLSGTVTVWLDVGEDGRRHRLATFGAGMAFGEMALLVEGPRSADVAADERVVAARLPLADLHDLERRRPELIAVIYRNLARTLGGRLRRANAQVRALEG